MSVSKEEADRRVAEAFGRPAAGQARARGEDFAHADRAVRGAFGHEVTADVEFRDRLMSAGLSEAGARMLMRDLEDGFEVQDAIAMASRFTERPNGVPSIVAAQVRPVVEARSARPAPQQLGESLRVGIEEVNAVERLRDGLRSGRLGHLREAGGWSADQAERSSASFADELVRAAESRAARFGWGRAAVVEDLEAQLKTHRRKWAKAREGRGGMTGEDAARAVAEAFGRPSEAVAPAVDLADEASRRDELKTEGWV